MTINFKFEYLGNNNKESCIDIKINSKVHTCIFKGRKWQFESNIRGYSTAS